MAQNFAGGAAIPTTNNQDPLSFGMDEQGNVGDHFVVAVLVTLGTHDFAVDREQLAILKGVVDLDALVG